jgi:crotonobetainyl-CoA:carnitine CoA-transferase CaiB-like acyl-CoA transferase
LAGSDTRAIMKELGYSDEEISEMEKTGLFD